MSEITDLGIVQFANQGVRQMAGRILDIMPTVQIMLAQWQSMAASIPNDETIIQDGRTDAQQLTGEDVHALLGLIGSFASDAGTANIVPILVKAANRCLPA